MFEKKAELEFFFLYIYIYILRQTFIIGHHLGKRRKDVVTRDFKVNILKCYIHNAFQAKSRAYRLRHTLRKVREPTVTIIPLFVV